MKHTPTIPPTGDTFLDTCRRSVMDAVQLHGGSVTQAGLVAGGALHPDGGPLSAYYVGAALRSLAEDGILTRQRRADTIVWTA